VGSEMEKTRGMVGWGASARRSNFLIAPRDFPYLLVFPPARHIDVDLSQWFARLLRDLVEGKPGRQLL